MKQVRGFKTAFALFLGSAVFATFVVWSSVDNTQGTVEVKQASVKTVPAWQNIRDTSEESIEHVVKKGESINAIAQKYDVLPWQLRAANSMEARETLIHPGDTLKVPGVDWSGRAYEGKASWYGPNFHGKKRADGEVYDQNEILVAHRTLPLGLKVKIVNLENGKAIIAEVKDRGPYTKDEKGRYSREIDLSRGAAKRLGAIEAGVIPVRIQPLG